MKSISSQISSLCTPAILNLVLGVVSTLSAITQVSIIMSIIHLFITIVWTLFLDFLCTKGYGSLSWFLVFLPYIFIVLFLVFAVALASSEKKDSDKKE